MSLKFDLEKFAVQPTQEQLDICRKDDLFSVADLYQITVPRGAVKRELKEVICKHLVEHGVFPEEHESAGVASRQLRENPSPPMTRFSVFPQYRYYPPGAHFCNLYNPEVAPHVKEKELRV